MARSDSDVRVRIRATDEASGSIRNVGNSLEGLKGRFSAAGVAGTAFAGIISGVVINRVKQLTQEFISLYAVQERAEASVAIGANRLRGIQENFDLSTQSIYNMASALQEITIFGDEEILQKVTAQMLSFTEWTNETFERAHKAILDISALTQTDLQSATMQVARLLQDPGMLGAASRMGIIFTQAQKDIARELFETAGAIEYQTYVLQIIENQYKGTATELSSTTTGMLEQMSNDWGDLKEQFGQFLIEALQPVLDFLKRIMDWFRKLPEAQQNFIFVATAAGALAVVVGVLTVAVWKLAAAVTAATGGMNILIGLLVASAVALATYIIFNWQDISITLRETWNEIVYNAFKFAYSFYTAIATPIDLVIDALIKMAHIWNQTFAQMGAARIDTYGLEDFRVNLRDTMAEGMDIREENYKAQADALRAEREELNRKRAEAAADEGYQFSEPALIEEPTPAGEPTRAPTTKTASGRSTSSGSSGNNLLIVHNILLESAAIQAAQLAVLEMIARSLTSGRDIGSQDFLQNAGGVSL